MKSAYLLAGIQLRIFLKLLRNHPFSWLPKYVFRIFFILQNAVWSSLFSWRERKKHGSAIAKHQMPSDPIFIIGHWRSGSTFLHQLMHLDPKLWAPTLFQTAQPASFVVSEKYYRPIMNMVLGKTRPFDEMKSGMYEPQEDEFAIVRLTGFSPMLGLVFPKKDRFFLNGNTAYLPEDASALNEWKTKARQFYNKLSWHSGKMLVLKNPFHSFRIKELLDMYPQARFIHIYRKPEDVVFSTIRMWSIVGSQNTLNRNWRNPQPKEITELFGHLISTVTSDKSLIPDGHFTEIRFEDLEQNPLETLKKAYLALGLAFTDDYQTLLQEYINSIRSYQKNRYSPSDTDRALVRSELISFYQQYHYDETT